MIIYHGSDKIIEKPVFGAGKTYNDYGRGFYCTEHVELAKEWACASGSDGYSNHYQLDMNGLSVLNLNTPEYNILNWLTILLVMSMYHPLHEADVLKFFMVADAIIERNKS